MRLRSILRTSITTIPCNHYTHIALTFHPAWVGRDMCACSDDVIQFTEGQREGMQNKGDSTVFLVMTPNVVRMDNGMELPAVSSPPSASGLEEALAQLTPQFNRYRLMRAFLEGEVTFDEMQPALALVLGFRASTDDSISIKHEADRGAHAWGHLAQLPDLTLLQGPMARVVAERLQQDLCANS